VHDDGGGVPRQVREEAVHRRDTGEDADHAQRLVADIAHVVRCYGRDERQPAGAEPRPLPIDLRLSASPASTTITSSALSVCRPKR
jgi:hypothetical protein